MPDAPATTTTTTTTGDDGEGATPPADPKAGAQPELELGDEGKKALDAERKARRDADKARKAAEAELEKLRADAMSDNEKAIAAAKAEGRTEALRETGAKLVEAEVRAATAGRGVDTDALLEGLDRSKFLGEDGDPDRDAIVAWVDRVAPTTNDDGAPNDRDGFPAVPNLGQGTRTDAPALGSDPLTQTLERMVGVRR